MLDFIPRRLIMAFMGIMAVVNVYMSRNNVPIAIIQMVNNTYLDANRNTSIKETTMCFGNASDDSGYSEPQVDGPLMLNQKQQTVLVACYFWGYTANQLTAGYFAYRFGFKLALGIGIGIGSVLTYLFPYIIMIPNYGFILAVITRVIIGFFHAPCFPAMQGAWTKWAPSSEKSRLVGAHFSGGPIGTFLINQLAGFVGDAYGWEPIFKVSGVLNLLFVVCWCFLVYDSPETHPYITTEERDFIVNTRSQVSTSVDKKTEKVPYKKILTSGPVWAMIMCHTAGNWGFYTIISLLPKYMADYQGKQIKEIGVMSSLPYILQTGTILLATALADMLQNRCHVRKIRVRKTFVLLSTVMPAGALLLMTTSGCNIYASLAMAITTQFFFAFNIAGAKCNPNDIGPQFASIIMSVANMVGNIPGFLSPQIAGALLDHYGRTSQLAWAITFGLGGVFVIIGGTWFLIWGSASIQEWDSSVENNKDEKVTLNNTANKKRTNNRTESFAVYTN